MTLKSQQQLLTTFSHSLHPGTYFPVRRQIFISEAFIKVSV